MSRRLTITEQFFYDDGWFAGATGTWVGERWRLMPPVWWDGYMAAVLPRLLDPVPAFSHRVRQESEIAIMQGVLAYLRGAPRPAWATDEG